MTCEHKNKKDLTQGLGSTRHFYCVDCKSHWYNNKEFTEKEWSEYIEVLF